jgi:hypothetical protein
MAVSPWAVMFSRKIWRGDMLPLFAALLIAATLALVVGGRQRAIFWVFLWSGVVAQTHYTGYPFVGAIMLFLIIYRPRISVLALLLGLVTLVGIYIPYGIFLAGGGWREILTFLSDRGSLGNPTSWIQQIEPIWHFVNLGNFPYLIGETSYYLNAKLGATAFFLYPLAALERWVFVGGFVWLVWRTLFPGNGPQHIRPVGVLLSLCIISQAVPCLVASWRCHPHYFTLILLVPFLVLGVTVDHGLARLRARVSSAPRYRVASALVGLVLAGIILTQVYFTATLFSIIRARGGAGIEYGVSYLHKASLAQYLAETYNPNCISLIHEWSPLLYWGVREEIDFLVRRLTRAKPCSSPNLQLFVLEAIDRPLSPQAEARLKPFQRFGPILLYTKAANLEP